MGDTFDKVKHEVKKTADKITDPDTYTGSDHDNESENTKGGKEPMNPEDIAEHKPTAVKRDKNQGSSGDPV